MAEASRALAAVSRLHGFERRPGARAVRRRRPSRAPAIRSRRSTRARLLAGGRRARRLARVARRSRACGPSSTRGRVVTRIRGAPGGDLPIFAPARRRGRGLGVDRRLPLRLRAARRRRLRLVLGDSFTDLFDTVADGYPGVSVRRLSLGEALTVLLTDPSELDVLVTEHVLFEALASLPRAHDGGRKVAAVGYVSPTGPGLFVPTHGPAADIAGQGVANPSELLLAAALLLGEGLERRSAAETLEDGVVARAGRAAAHAGHGRRGRRVDDARVRGRGDRAAARSRRDTDMRVGVAV